MVNTNQLLQNKLPASILVNELISYYIANITSEEELKNTAHNFFVKGALKQTDLDTIDYVCQQVEKDRAYIPPVEEVEPL